jgi:hypothetical protein
MVLNEIEKTLHEQFSTYGKNAREWMRRCVVLLPEIERRRIWRKKRFRSIYEYAGKIAGMSHANVDEALRVLKKIKDKPALLELVKEKGLQRVRPVASIATPETADFWAEKVRMMSKHTLETYVHDFRSEFLPGEKIQSVKVSMDLSSKTAARLEKLRAGRTWEELICSLLDPPEKPAAVKTESRHIPKKIERYVRAKTSGLCAHPHCTRPATSLHHTQRFALERVHDPARLHSLCTGHERLAHLGLIAHEEKSPEQWRLRKEPDQADHKFYIDRFVALYRPT